MKIRLSGARGIHKCTRWSEGSNRVEWGLRTTLFPALALKIGARIVASNDGTGAHRRAKFVGKDTGGALGEIPGSLLMEPAENKLKYSGRNRD